MKAGTLATSLLLVTSIVACTEISAPPQVAPDAAMAAGAFQERGEGVFVQAGLSEVDCLDEPLELNFVLPFTYHVTETPSGHRIFTDQIRYGAGTGTAVGVNSGRVWTLQVITGPEIIRVTAGESYQTIGVSRLVRDGGPDLHFFTSYHIVQNANGEIVTEKLTVRCRAR